MTVTTQIRKAVHTGNGTTIDFPLAGKVLDEAHVEVDLYEIATDITTGPLSSALYTITGIGDPDGISVKYPLSGSPLASTHKIIIKRVVPYTQDLDIINEGGFYPDTLETQLDLLEMQIQQNTDNVKLPDVVVPGTVPLFGNDGESLINGPDAGDIADAQANAATATAAAIAAAASAASVSVGTAANYTALKALAAGAFASVIVQGRVSAADKGGGTFVWDSASRTAEVTADSQEGIWVPPSSDTSGASGAWKRQTAVLKPEYFGVVSDDGVGTHASNNVTGLQAMFDYIAEDSFFEVADCSFGKIRVDSTVYIRAATAFKLNRNLITRLSLLAHSTFPANVPVLQVGDWDGAYQLLTGLTLRDISIDCAGFADYGIWLENFFDMDLAGINVIDPGTSGIYERRESVAAGDPTNLGTYPDANHGLKFIGGRIKGHNRSDLKASRNVIGFQATSPDLQIGPGVNFDWCLTAATFEKGAITFIDNHLSMGSSSGGVATDEIFTAVTFKEPVDLRCTGNDIDFGTIVLEGENVLGQTFGFWRAVEVHNSHQFDVTIAATNLAIIELKPKVANTQCEGVWLDGQFMYEGTGTKDWFKITNVSPGTMNPNAFYKCGFGTRSAFRGFNVKTSHPKGHLDGAAITQYNVDLTDNFIGEGLSIQSAWYCPHIAGATGSGVVAHCRTFINRSAHIVRVEFASAVTATVDVWGSFNIDDYSIN